MYLDSSWAWWFYTRHNLSTHMPCLDRSNIDSLLFYSCNCMDDFRLPTGNWDEHNVVTRIEQLDIRMDNMKKLLIFMVLFFMVTMAYAEESTFRAYGVDHDITIKYQGLFDVPIVEFMGGVFGEFVYAVTMISDDGEYYCIMLIEQSRFKAFVDKKGVAKLEVEKSTFSDSRIGPMYVNDSYTRSYLIPMPF